MKLGIWSHKYLHTLTTASKDYENPYLIMSILTETERIFSEYKETIKVKTVMSVTNKQYMH